MRSSNLTAYLITMALFSLPKISYARDKLIDLPDEAFLEFLGGTFKVDGEMTDPLDMLEMEKNDLIDDKLKQKLVAESANEKEMNSLKENDLKKPAEASGITKENK